MKRCLNALLIIMIILLMTVAPCLAAPPTREGPSAPHPTPDNKPKIGTSDDKLGQKLLMFLPKKLTIANFTFEVLSWDPGSTLNNASGAGNAKFNCATSDYFKFRFKNLKIELTPPGQSNLGRVIEGEINLDLKPKVQVTMGTMPGAVTKLQLNANPQVNKVDLEVRLPSLWTRNKLPGGTTYLPAKQAYLYIADQSTTQDLDIFLTDYKNHGLSEVGIGDTNIIMDCTNMPLIVDLSVKQPANNYPALTGVLFLGIKTIPQDDRLNTNAGFCFGEYLLNGGLNYKGLYAKLELQKKFDYYPSVPQGYKISLDPGIDQGLQINQNSIPNNTATQQNIIWLQGADPGQNPGGTQGLPINQQNSGSNKSPQQQSQLTLVNHCTLTIAESAILKGSLSGKITLPAPLVTKTGNPVEYSSAALNVDANLNLIGEATCHDPVYWGKCLNHQQTSFILQSDKVAHCYFPGAARPKMDCTTGSGGQETFANPNDLTKLPGITLTSFNLTIRTKDANLKEIYFPFETEFDKQKNFKNIYKVAAGQNQFWINFGTAGINGKMNVEAKLAYDNSNPAFPCYPVELGNPNSDDNPLTLLGGSYLPFKAYFHSNQWIDPAKTQKDGQPDSANKTKITRYFGPFFHADFIDSAVFDLGIDGHFFVDGPSNIYPMFNELAATSTADLCSSQVTVNATLDYWGVDLKTDKSRLVPKVTQVFFLGATIEEMKHYEIGFPVVWGLMTSDGNIPAMLFGYTYQTFDHLAYSYRDVHLSTYNKQTDKPNGIRGALVSEGDVFFAYFDPPKMTINDFNDRTPGFGENTNFEGRHIEIKAKYQENGADVERSYFPVSKTWGVNKQTVPTIAFNFPHVAYFDGTENEDGFRQRINPDAPENLRGTSELRDFPGKISSEIHITGLGGSKITIPDDPNDKGHKVLGNSGVFLTHIHTDDKNPFVFKNDSLPNFKLLGKFDGSSPILGGFSDEFAVNVRPEASDYQLDNPNNQSNLTKNIAINFGNGAINITGQTSIMVTLKDDRISGDIQFNDVHFQAGPALGGHGSGKFGVTIGANSKYIQGYGTVTISGIPWPAPNSGGGALFLGYGANSPDIYALDYIDRSTIMNNFPTTVSGFYLAAKLGYNYSLCGLGDAYIYIAGGTGLFNSDIVFQAGVDAGIEVCDIGLESSAYVSAGTNINNIDAIVLRGHLTYTLSLLFVDFSWSGTITLTDGGVST